VRLSNAIVTSTPLAAPRDAAGASQVDDRLGGDASDERAEGAQPSINATARRPRALRMAARLLPTAPRAGDQLRRSARQPRRDLSKHEDAPTVGCVRPQLLVLLAVFVPFTAFSVRVIGLHGFGGLFDLVGRDPWALQMFLDVLIFYTLFSAWMVGDARARKIPSWPYVIATMTMGAMGALAYLVHRELRTDAT
jgi:hypothetical protein